MAIPTAITIRSCNTKSGGIRIVFDFSSDFINPNAGVKLDMSGVELDVNLANSVQTINGNIRTAIINTVLPGLGFANHGITLQDIIIFGGAH